MKPAFKCLKCKRNISCLKYARDLDGNKNIVAVSFACPSCGKKYWLSDEDGAWSVAEWVNDN